MRQAQIGRKERHLQASRPAAVDGAQAFTVSVSPGLANAYWLDDGQYTDSKIAVAAHERYFSSLATRQIFADLLEKAIAAKKAGLAIWLDEIQTFARTGELFAFQSLNIEQQAMIIQHAFLAAHGEETPFKFHAYSVVLADWPESIFSNPQQV